MLLLKFRRLQRGLTQEGLSRLSGVPRAQISMLETGHLKPWPGYVQKLANALDWCGDPVDLFKEVKL